jgi:hypothetical protein
MMNLALELLYLFTLGCDFSEFRDILRHETDCFTAVLPLERKACCEFLSPLKHVTGRRVIGMLNSV